MHAVDQRVDLVARVVQVETGAAGCRHAEAADGQLGTVMTGADGDPLRVEHRADVVRMHSTHVEGDHPAALVGVLGPVDVNDLGRLEALQGVRKFPVRVKCAVLAWNVLQDALELARVEGR